MGLMDKFKNLFTDEEIIEEDEEEKEVEIKEVKKEEEPKLPTFMREKIAKEEKKEEVKIKPQLMQPNFDIDIKREIKLEKDLPEESQTDKQLEEKNTFKFPIDFTENDFTEKRESRQSLYSNRERKIEHQPEHPVYSREGNSKERQFSQNSQDKKELKVSELYKDKRTEKKEQEKKFRATPIISPIYGILDKNYNSEEMEKNKGENFEERRPSKSVDFDSVRKKAYGGTLKSTQNEEKINKYCENCEYLKEAKECRKNTSNERDYHEELLGDLQENNFSNYNEPSEEYEENSYNNITLDEAAENYYDYGVEYEKENDFTYGLNESYYSNKKTIEPEEPENVRIMNHVDEQKTPRKKEIPPVKSSINLLSTLKKSMGDPVDTVQEPVKENKNLELTDDLFNLIDSMYDERNDK